MTYLTDVWGLSITKAADIVNIWNGIENLMQLVFAFLAEELMGKYLLLLLSSIAYSIFGIPALCTLLATLLFISGSRSYNTSREEKDKPLTDVIRVFVASASKIFQRLPDDHNQLYGTDDESAQNLPYTGLRFLDKAAIISTTKTKEEQEKNKWTLCSVKEVEAAKKLVRMAPICATFIICGVVISVGNTYYVVQANHLNRKLGRVTFPLSLFLAWMELSKMVNSKMYSLMQIGILKLYEMLPTKEIRKFVIFFLIAMTFWIHIYIGLSSITAAKVETRRLQTIRKHSLLDKPEERIPMSIFWLLPQFSLLGAGEAVYKCCIAQFIIYHLPLCMNEYWVFFHKGVMGLGTIGSVLSIYLAGKVSEIGGKPNWFQYTLNKSRLDHYYWTLAVLCAVNFALYGLAICFYELKALLNLDEPDKEVLIGEMLAEL
ncbi:hypothetical protein LguiA_029349 [Lonicera macranthoides]